MKLAAHHGLFPCWRCAGGA